jgi:hypothetical protein
MGMFKPGGIWQRFLDRSHDVEPDYVLDHLIRDALVEDTLLRPSAGAWERLRQVIIERQHKNHGMWVLDEPLRDPPESPPLQLNSHQYKRAMQIYNGQTGFDSRREIMMYRNTIWGGTMPTLSALLNW